MACSRAFDFVEIGSSSYDTLIASRPAHERELTVDPVAVHLKALPLRRNTTKVHAAIGEVHGSATFFYVHPSAIAAHRLPHFLKGCTMVGEPHPLAVAELRKRGLERLMQNGTVRVLTLRDLFVSYCVGSVGTFKVDTEGMEDHALSARRAAQRLPPPKSITFEANWLNEERRVAANDINRQLVRMGYKHSWRGQGELTDASLRRWCSTEGAPAGVYHCWDQRLVWT